MTNTDKRPVIPGKNPRSSIDFTKDLDSMQKEHERLDERYHLQKSNLNLQMEVTRMRGRESSLMTGENSGCQGGAGTCGCQT
jgi:hypothetical protein